MSTAEIRKQVAIALEAVESKKAEDVTLLQLPQEASALSDYFLICSGTNPRQVQAIADEVDDRLSKMGVEPLNREGYQNAEWILLDYVDFVVHIFSSQERLHNLERLWHHARHLTLTDLTKPAKKAPVTAGVARKGASKTPVSRMGARPAAKKVAKKVAGKAVKKAAPKTAGRGKAAAKPAAKKTAKKAAKKK